MDNVLLVGGSGLIGARLGHFLSLESYNVAHLTRKIIRNGNVKQFVWDIDQGLLEDEAINWADHIIYLGGATVAKRWTSKYRKEILASRVAGIRLLAYKWQGRNLKSFISASAIGIYGSYCGVEIREEESEVGDDFLAQVVSEWEQAADELDKISERVVKLRIGIVLTRDGGALKKMVAPVKLGLGSPLGSGKQMMTWIHIDDLCRIFIRALSSDMAGTFNAVSPGVVSNKEFIATLAEVLRKPMIFPAVPAVVLKLMLGEMSSLVLGGVHASSGKIETTGFQFLFDKLKPALLDIYDKTKV